jgi:tRNA-dihydrouridine synthase
MIGRAAIGYPWFFREVKHFFETGEKLAPPSFEERIEVIRQHLRASVAWKGPRIGIFEMRRHYANYLKGIPHIKPLRTQLVTLNTLEEIEDLLNSLNPAHFQDLSVVQEA